MNAFWGKNNSVKDAERWKRPEAYFDHESADHAVQFIETACRHVKGELAGQPLKLEKWQREIVRGIFGWKKKDDHLRLFRRVYIEIPRKNGKSTLGAALALYLLFADGEPGAEIYSAAADTDQASIVFSIAKQMVDLDSDLAKVSQSFRRSIIYKSNTYQVLSADAPTKHGKNSHGIIFDELHAQPNRELFDVLKTSMGARRQPLMIMFTTAGYDRSSVCGEIHDYALKILDGTLDDPSFLPIIFCADDSDDWTDWRTWKKANPNFGISIKRDYLEAECEAAKSVIAQENTFKRLHLNIWTQQETRWLSMAKWDLCGQKIDEASLVGKECYAGLDLAKVEDLSALVLVFPPTRLDDCYTVLPYFFIPEEDLMQRIKRDRVPYDAWRRAGLIDITPGAQIDYDFILHRIAEIRSRFNLRRLAYDRWGAPRIVSDLIDRYGFITDESVAERTGQPVLCQFGQGFASMSAPSKELLNLILARKINHGGNPILRWMANNVVVVQDAAGNIKPDKQKSREKIDGIVALIMAIDLATRHARPKPRSVYEERDVLFV